MDRFSPVASAAIRVLVVPAGKTDRSRFLNIFSKLQRSAATIELSELDQDGTKHLLSPTNFPQGFLLLNYTNSLPTEHERQLPPYELFREALLVVGVADGLSEKQEPQKELVDVRQKLHKQHPHALLRHIILFDDEEQASVDGVTVVQPQHAFNGPVLRAAMCEVAARFLSEFATYATALQASPTIKTPGQINKSLKRMSSQQGTPAQSTTVSRPTSNDSSRPPSRGLGSPPPATSFDQMERANNVPTALAKAESTTSGRSGQNNGARASSQERVSVHGFGPSISKEKDKNRGKARVGIVVGHIHMMAGQWKDAMRILVEHTTVARKLSDNLWHAKGLEGILACMLLLAWAGVEFTIPSICYATTERSSSHHAAKLSVNLPSDYRPAEIAYQTAVGRLSNSLPELLKYILALYRSGEGALELPTLMLHEVMVRFCHLLAILGRENGELNGSAREQIVEPARARPSEKPLGPAAFSTLPKTTITAMLSDALLADEDQLDAAHYIQILAGIGSVYSLLGMERKKADVLMNMVNRLTAALIQARKVGAAEAGIHPAASLSTDTGAESIMAIAATHAGVQDLLNKLAQIYDINLRPAEGSEHQLGGAMNMVSQFLGFGNEVLKVAVLRALLAFCEAVPDPEGVLDTATYQLRTAVAYATHGSRFDMHGDTIARDEQIRLATTIARTAEVSKRLGLGDMYADYWDACLVRDIDFTAPDTAHRLVSNVQGGLGAGGSDQSTNPLLYDPNAKRSSTAAQARILLVCNEVLHCQVTLQNRLHTAVEIESITLVTEGQNAVELKTSGFQRTMLQPQRSQQVSFSVSPTAIGDFSITGCRIKISCCREQVFPIVALSEAQIAEPLVKYHGRNAAKNHELSAQARHVAVLATAVTAMPFLERQIDDLSMMLLEGEKQTLRVVVRNTSQDTPAAICNIKDASGALRLKSREHGVSNVDLSDHSIVELDQDGWPQLDQDGTPTWKHVPEVDQLKEQDPAAIAILRPKEVVMLSFDVIGKAGVSDVQLDITYRATPSGMAGIYARLLSVPLCLTMQPALKVRRVNVVDDINDGFVLSFDIQNASLRTLAYGVEVSRKQWSGLQPANMEIVFGEGIPEEILLGPSQVRRISERFNRVRFLQDERTMDEVEAEMLRRIKVVWRTWDGDARWGEVDLTGLKLGRGPLKIIRGRLAGITLEVVGATSSPHTTGSFVTVRMTLINGVARQVSPLLVELRSPAQKSLGLLGASQITVPPLASQEQAQVDFVLCPMVHGLLELEAHATPAIPPGGEGNVWRTEESLLLQFA